MRQLLSNEDDHSMDDFVEDGDDVDDLMFGGELE
tara:strand:- start:674 stop:775 length:102 start_codon:yes stop_codon:yes gene_type:complete